MTTASDRGEPKAAASISCSQALRYVKRTLERQLGQAWNEERRQIWLTKVGEPGRELPQIKLGITHDGMAWRNIAQLLLPSENPLVQSGLMRGHDPDEITLRAPLLGIATPHQTIDLERWVPPGSGVKPSLGTAVFMAYAPFRPERFGHAIRWSKELAKHAGRGEPQMPDSRHLTSMSEACEFIYDCIKAEICWGLSGIKRDDHRQVLALANADSLNPADHLDLDLEWKAWHSQALDMPASRKKSYKAGTQLIREALSSPAACGVTKDEIPTPSGRACQISVAWAPWGGQRMALFTFDGRKTALADRGWAQLVPDPSAAGAELQ